MPGPDVPLQGHRPSAPAGIPICAAALFLLMLGASLLLAGPQVFADEGSYLLNAATISGRIAANPHYGYYSGYSALLVPAFLVARDADTVYHAALAINALLLATMPFAFYAFTRRLWPALDARRHALAAIGASAYAPMLVLSQFTMSEAALLPAFAWFMANAAAVFERDRRDTALVLGGLGGALFLLHPRGALMALPVLAILSFSAALGGLRWRTIATAWLAFFVVAALHGPIESLAGRTATHKGGYSVPLLLSRLVDPHNLPWIGANAIGAATEAIVTSLGLVVVAVCCAATESLQAVRDGIWRDSGRVALLTACVLSWASALLVTGIFFAPPDRADQIAYGRYALPTLLPLIAIALLRLQMVVPKARDIGWVIGTGIVCLAVCAAAFACLPEAARLNWNFLNSVGLYAAQKFLPTDQPWLSIAICFLVSVSVLAAIARRCAPTAVWTFVALNALVATFIWTTVVRPGSTIYSIDRPLVAAARALDAVAEGHLRIALAGDVDLWETLSLGARLFPQMRPCPAQCIVASIRPLESSVPRDERLVAIDPPSPIHGAPTALYIAPGPTVDAYARDHEVPSEGFVPLAAEDRNATTTIDPPPRGSVVLRVGQTLDVRVRVVNLGSRTLSGPAGNLLPMPLRVGARLSRPDGSREYRGVLYRPIAPGATGYGHVRIGPIDRPGSYTLELGMLQESVAWFDGGTDTSVLVEDR
jgi:hypothetical protein